MGLSMPSLGLGGVGLFLVGVWLATDALKVAGGGYLRANLARWTANRGRAFLTGLSISVLLPSSGPLTFAFIGFVNCGLVRLSNALWVLAGAGFGSVITSWMVVAAASSLDHYHLALSYVAVGAVLRLTGAQSARGAWGQALVGLGLLLLGIQVLGDAFAGMGASARLDAPSLAPMMRHAVGFASGLALAALLQSSSATIAIALLAASAGRIDFGFAACAMVGANLGASASAVRTLLGGTPDARRVAAGHVVFHAMTSLAGGFLLVWILPFVGRSASVQASPLISLAGFHTMFVACGALLFWPFGAPLARMLTENFMEQEADDRRPSALDEHLLAIPDLALAGLLREVDRIADAARRMGRTVLQGEQLTEFRQRMDRGSADALAEVVDDYVARLYRAEIPRSVADPLLEVPRASQAWRKVAMHIAEYGRTGLDVEAQLDAPLRARLGHLKLAVLHLVEGANSSAPGFQIEALRGELGAVELHVRDLKRRLLAAAPEGRHTPDAIEELFERVASLRRIARLSVDAAERLHTARAPRHAAVERAAARELVPATGQA